MLISLLMILVVYTVKDIFARIFFVLSFDLFLAQALTALIHFSLALLFAASYSVQEIHSRWCFVLS